MKLRGAGLGFLDGGGAVKLIKVADVEGLVLGRDVATVEAGRRLGLETEPGLGFDADGDAVETPCFDADGPGLGIETVLRTEAEAGGKGLVRDAGPGREAAALATKDLAAGYCCRAAAAGPDGFTAVLTV